MKNLFNILNHLPDNKVKELETITQRIVETGMVSVILLYGSYARGDWKETIGGRSGKKSDYDILVLTKDERDCQDLKNKLFRMFDNFATVVQPLVETLGFVNMHLRERQYFFTEIKQEGIILYAEDNVELAKPENLSATRLREIAELDFKQWFRKAQINYEDALGHIEKGSNDKVYFQTSAFDLQQCVENCYTSIEMAFSRNNPYEHRLNILRMNAKRYVPEIDNYFPQNTDKERYLFFHLDAAYIGGRYIDEQHYKVTKKQLYYWEKEAQNLLAITEKVCRQKIKELKEKELRN